MFAEALGDTHQKIVANRMAERVVDVFEMIEIEKHHRDLLLRARRLDMGCHQLVQLGAVWQPRQRIEVSKARDLTAGFVAFNRKRTEINAVIDDGLVPARWRL